VQYHDIGLDLDETKHAGGAIEARFDGNIARVTGRGLHSSTLQLNLSRF
jgi:hypothetical protein